MTNVITSDIKWSMLYCACSVRHFISRLYFYLPAAHDSMINYSERSCHISLWLVYWATLCQTWLHTYTRL